MLIVLGTISINPAQLSAAKPVMRQMVEASMAEEGCLTYSYAEDVLQPGLIRVTEQWRDKESLARHFETEHLRQWRASWPSLGISERNLMLFEADAGEAV